MEQPDIPGAQAFVDWFGYWPSFHDAEVVSLSLSRDSSSEVRIHFFKGTSAIDEKGRYVFTNHCIVAFVFTEITNVELGGFNHQNVLSGLFVKTDGAVYELLLDDCYGLAGRVFGTGLSLEYSEGIPSGSVYS